MPRNSLIQFRRGTAAAIRAAAATVGANAEPFFATDTGELFMADGSLPPRAVSRSFNGVGNPPSSAIVIPFNTISTSAAAPSSGQLTLYPIDIWPGPLAIKALAYQVTTALATPNASAVARAVLYADNGTGNGALVSSAGLLASIDILSAVQSTGVKLPAFSTTLQPGRYWAGLLWYQGGGAPGTAAQYNSVSSGTALWASSTSISVSRGLARTGLTTTPTDGTIFTPTTATQPMVGLQVA